MCQEEGFKFCLNTRNIVALLLDPACPECLSVRSPASLPYNIKAHMSFHIEATTRPPTTFLPIYRTFFRTLKNWTKAAQLHPDLKPQMWVSMLVWILNYFISTDRWSWIHRWIKDSVSKLWNLTLRSNVVSFDLWEFNSNWLKWHHPCTSRSNQAAEKQEDSSLSLLPLITLITDSDHWMSQEPCISSNVRLPTSFDPPAIITQFFCILLNQLS
jgi:hypothetical protein